MLQFFKALSTGVTALVFAFLLFNTYAAAQSSTLSKVVERDRLHCGVATGIIGFALQQDEQWTGMDIDLCRAVAAAALGSPDKIRIVPTTSSDRFDLLRNGNIDVLLRSSAWTASRDLQAGLRFAGVNFFNGLTLMVNTGLLPDGQPEPGPYNLADVANAEICVTTDNGQIDALQIELERRKISVVLQRFDSSEESQQAYEAERCLAILAEAYSLMLRRRDVANPENHVLLPDFISLEPLGPVVLETDGQWSDFVAWVMYALISAEEQGLTDGQATLAAATGDTYFEGEAVFSDQFKLPSKAPLRSAIAAVGNYGQIFDRNFSDLIKDRGPNALWRDGGLLYAPSFK